jgi:hypothetical protein
VASYYLFMDGGVETTLAFPEGSRPPVDCQSACNNCTPKHAVDPRSEEPGSQTAETKGFSADKAAQSSLADTMRRLANISANDYDAASESGAPIKPARRDVGCPPLRLLREEGPAIASAELLIWRAPCRWRLLPGEC